MVYDNVHNTVYNSQLKGWTHAIQQRLELEDSKGTHSKARAHGHQRQIYVIE